MILLIIKMMLYTGSFIECSIRNAVRFDKLLPSLLLRSTRMLYKNSGIVIVILLGDLLWYVFSV